MGVFSKKVSEGRLLTDEQAVEVVAKAMPEEEFRGRKVLLIIPDATRTAPVGTMFKAIHEQVGGATKSLDVMIALGTHPPMSETAIERRLATLNAVGLGYVRLGQSALTLSGGEAQRAVQHKLAHRLGPAEQ